MSKLQNNLALFVLMSLFSLCLLVIVVVLFNRGYAGLEVLILILTWLVLTSVLWPITYVKQPRLSKYVFMSVFVIVCLISIIMKHTVLNDQPEMHLDIITFTIFGMYVISTKCISNFSFHLNLFCYTPALITTTILLEY
jgi:hypothetical protein